MWQSWLRVREIAVIGPSHGPEWPEVIFRPNLR
jgi:hypothetical protein